jgi:hypothetical protein
VQVDGGGGLRDAAAKHRAGQLLSRYEGATTAVVRTVAARDRLTPGELDIAVQAAAGRSNKHVAADSHLPVGGTTRRDTAGFTSSWLHEVRDVGMILPAVLLAPGEDGLGCSRRLWFWSRRDLGWANG